jgi:uncharacterized protein (TIGR02996 family)
VLEDLLRARGALERDELAEALAALLAAWRHKRAVHLSDLIDRVSSELTTKLPSLAKGRLATRWEHWRAVAERQSPPDLERLVSVALPRKYTDAEPLVRLLMRWPDDPRLARFLARLVAGAAFTPKHIGSAVDGLRAFYRSMMQRLVELGDSRSLRALEERAYLEPRHRAWRSDLARHASQLRQRPVPVLDATERLLIEEMASRCPTDAAATPLGKQLLAGVYEQPHDLAARAVWADFLTERGDPRGEFITLQLARRANVPTEAARKRERSLLKDHAVRWMGSIGRWFDEKNPIFEDGLFAGGRYAARAYDGPRLDAEILRDLAWRVIRELDIHEYFDPSLLSHPNLAGVRRLRAPDRLVRKLSQTTWPFEELVVTELSMQRITAHPLATGTAFPALKVLGFYGCVCQALAWLDGAPMLDRLEHVIFGTNAVNTVPLLPGLTRSALPRVSIRDSFDMIPSGWDHELTRDHRGMFGRLRSRLFYRPGLSPAKIEMDLRFTLQELPRDQLTEVVIERSTSTLGLPRDGLAKELARFQSLESVRLPWD